MVYRNFRDQGWIRGSICDSADLPPGQYRIAYDDGVSLVDGLDLREYDGSFQGLGGDAGSCPNPNANPNPNWMVGGDAGSWLLMEPDYEFEAP